MTVEMTSLPDAVDIIAPYWPTDVDEDAYGQLAESRLERSRTTEGYADDLNRHGQTLAASDNSGQTVMSLGASIEIKSGKLRESAARAAAEAENAALSAQNIFNTKNMLNALAADYQAGHEALTAASISGGGTQMQIEAARAQLKQQAQMAAGMIDGGFQMAHSQLTGATVAGTPMGAAPSMMPPTMPSSAGTMPGWGTVPSVTSPQLAGMPGMAGGQQMTGMQGAGAQPGSLIGHMMQMAPTLMEHVANSPVGQAIDGIGQRFEQAAAAAITGESAEGGAQPGGLGSLLPGFGSASGSGEAQLGDYRATGSFDAQGSSLTVDGDITRDGDDSGSGAGGRGMGGAPAAGGGSGSSGSSGSSPSTAADDVAEAVEEAVEDAEDVAEDVVDEATGAGEPTEPPADVVEEVNEGPLPPSEAETTTTSSDASYARANIDIETPNLSAYGEASIGEVPAEAPADTAPSSASDATTETTSDRGATATTSAPAAAAAPAAAGGAMGGGASGGMMPVGAMGAMGAAAGAQSSSSSTGAGGPLVGSSTLQPRDVASAVDAKAAREAAELTDKTDGLLDFFDESVAGCIRIAARLSRDIGPDASMGVARLVDGTYVYSTADMLGMPGPDDSVPTGALPLGLALQPEAADMFHIDWAGADDPAALLLMAASTGLIGEIESLICVNRDSSLPPLDKCEIIAPTMVATATPAPADTGAMADWPRIVDGDDVVADAVAGLVDEWNLADVEATTADFRSLMADQRWDERPTDDPSAPLAASVMWLVSAARDAVDEGNMLYASVAALRALLLTPAQS